jgi:hypothetical protein
VLADQLSDPQAYVLAEIEALGLDVLEIRRRCRTQITVIR